MQPSQTPIFEIVAREDFSDATYPGQPRDANEAGLGELVECAKPFL